MAFDGLFTAAMTQELQQIKDGRISKIHQPNAQEVVLLCGQEEATTNFLFPHTHRIPAYS